jgi:hypothetical protein
MSKKYPTKTEIEAAKTHYEHCARVLAAREILWKDRWNAAHNPFIAVRDYLSTKQRAERKPFIDAWIDAKEAYDAIKPKAKSEETN